MGMSLTSCESSNVYCSCCWGSTHCRRASTRQFRPCSCDRDGGDRPCRRRLLLPSTALCAPPLTPRRFLALLERVGCPNVPPSTILPFIGRHRRPPRCPKRHCTISDSIVNIFGAAARAARCRYQCILPVAISAVLYWRHHRPRPRSHYIRQTLCSLRHCAAPPDSHVRVCCR